MITLIKSFSAGVTVQSKAASSTTLIKSFSAGVSKTSEEYKTRIVRKK